VKRIINDQVFLLRAPEGPLAVYVALFSKWASGQDARRVRCGGGFGSATGLSRWLAQKAVRFAQQALAKTSPPQDAVVVRGISY
jgi:hypothetical protein